MTFYLSIDMETGETELHRATTTKKPNEIVATNNDGIINIELIPKAASNIITVIASDNIQTGKCVSIDERTGKAKIATNNNLCIGIALSDCMAGQSCDVLTNGIFTLSSPLPDEFIGVLFKQDNGSVSTLEPDIFIQQVGFLLNNEIIINISFTPIYMMGVV